MSQTTLDCSTTSCKSVSKAIPKGIEPYISRKQRKEDKSNSRNKESRSVSIKRFSLIKNASSKSRSSISIGRLNKSARITAGGVNQTTNL